MISDNDCLTPLGLLLSSLSYGDYWQCRDYLNLAPQAASWDWSYFTVFAWTNALEFPAYFLLLASPRFERAAIVRLFAICLALNLATHPLISFAFPILFAATTYKTYLVAAEIFAPLVEALLLATAFKFSWGRALFAALAANLLSWWLGVYLT